MSRDETAVVRYRDLFTGREFSALFVADVVSRLGSQLGRFALAALVYERTGSPLLTAATIAVSYLPGLVGGPILATLADRLPRRGLLVACDLVRCGLVAAIALGDLPILVALAVLLLVELVKAPFGAARVAILADILTGDRFTVGNALVAATNQVVQVLGFGLGGLAVVVMGARSALLADAATYLLSAVVLLLFVHRRPAPERPPGASRPRLLGDTAEGFRVVRDTPRLPPLFWLLTLGPAVLITAEALAIPYARHLGLETSWAGVFMAAAPLGSATGLALMGRASEALRERLLIPFCVLVGVFVAAAGFTRSPVVVAACLFAAGLAMGHIAHLQSLIVALVASHVRGRVIGLGNTTLLVGQAVAALLAGVVAENTSIQLVFVAAGVAGTLAVLVGAAFRSPHGGKHRASPRQLRRERRESRPSTHRESHQGRLIASLGEPDLHRRPVAR